jgi:3-hydroxy-9,10-secoandrosta-1,3,5(10)-triene-9,17-dione monooxygenase
MPVTTLPPEPGLTPEAMVARAEAIAETLVARQAEAEQRTYYAEDVHAQFAEAGFYRILVPRRYGGYEFGPETFFRVTAALTRGCSSTGWMFCLGAAHAQVVASLFDEPAQAELFAGGDFIAPLPIAPTGTAERTENGDWLVNGTWHYCSGAPYGTHLIAHALVAGEDGRPPTPLLFVAPRAQWQVLDDWGGHIGLKGSGSHTVTMVNGIVPDRFTRPVHLGEISPLERLPGREIHGNDEFGGPLFSFMSVEGAAICLGMAKGALDAYTELMHSRKTVFPPIVDRVDDPDYQLWYGEAVSLIDAGEAAMLHAVRRWRELAAGQSATPQDDLRVALLCRQSVTLSWRAVESYLLPTAGSSAVRAGERLERVWRDLSTGRTHPGFSVFLSAAANRLFTVGQLTGTAPIANAA